MCVFYISMSYNKTGPHMQLSRGILLASRYCGFSYTSKTDTPNTSTTLSQKLIDFCCLAIHFIYLSCLNIVITMFVWLLWKECLLRIIRYKLTPWQTPRCQLYTMSSSTSDLTVNTTLLVMLMSGRVISSLHSSICCFQSSRSPSIIVDNDNPMAKRECQQI